MDESSPLPGGGTLTALSSRCKAGVRRDRSNLGTRARQNADSTAMYSMSWRATSSIRDPDIVRAKALECSPSWTSCGDSGRHVTR
jgi:hypothetical protein